MANEKQLKSRLLQKHDTEENWNKAINFIPKDGEIIIYDTDASHLYPRIKIGNGKDNVNTLKFTQSQGDWNQNDETATDYIKNRTHWSSGLKEIVLLEENGIEIITPEGYELPSFIELKTGNKYKVILNDTEYECIAWYMPDFGAAFIGNGSMFGMDTGNNEPFITDGEFIVIMESGTYDIKISTIEEDIHYLDSKFIKDMYYDSREYQDVEITFDGNLEGKETITFGDNWRGWVKISEEAYSADAFIGRNLSCFEYGDEYNVVINNNFIEYISNDAYYIEDILVVLNDTEIDDISYTRGVWSYYEIDDEYEPLAYYIKSFHVDIPVNGTLKKIDSKYIPDDILYMIEDLKEYISSLEKQIEEQNSILNDNIFIVATPSPTSYFITNGNGCITGLTDEGKAASDIMIPTVINNEKITDIGSKAFKDCTNLTSIVIPDNVTSIGDSAFSGCTNLTNITIGNGVTSIGSNAFSSCTSLTSITIPDNVTSIGNNAFNNCICLATVYYTGTEEQWNNISIDATGNTSLINATKVCNYVPAE